MSFHNTISDKKGRLKSGRRFRILLHDIRESLLGKEQDYTSGSMKRALLLLSIPMVIEMIMESVFAIVDIFFVAKLGPDAVATVGLTESMLTIVYAVSFGLATATSAKVSRRIGEKDYKGASKTAVQAIWSGLISSTVISLPGILFPGELLKLMGANQEIVTRMSGYTQIALGSNLVIMMLFIINSAYRSAGNASLSMRVLMLANGINIVLDPMLIFGIGPFPAMGVEGAAIATATGRGIGVLFQLYILLRGKGILNLRGISIKPDLNTIGEIYHLSLGAIGQNIIATSSWIILMRIISVFGSHALAGYTIAIRILIFALLPSWGLSNAASTLVGQNLGAGQPDRAASSVKLAGKVNVIIMGIIGIVFIIFPQNFISLFIDKPEVIRHGTDALRIISCGFAFYGLGMVYVNAMNGAGDTLTPIKLNLLCFWIIEIPLAYLLALTFGMGSTGVYLSIILAETSLTLLAWRWFAKGKWREIKV